MCMIFSFSHSEYGGLRDTAATLGLSNSIEIKLARIERNETGAHCYAINTDLQVQLELENKESGKDSLQGEQCD